MYEGFFIPREVGRVRRRPFPPQLRAQIGLIGRQRRFLRAAYTLADAGMDLEALGPLRAMFEFLVCQLWLDLDPERNWRRWMEEDHRKRDVWRDRLKENAPALHDAALQALTAEQHQEAAQIAEVRERVRTDLGERQVRDRDGIEQRAAQVSLSFYYDSLYRFQSSAAAHATLFSVDLLLEPAKNGLLLRGAPTSQFPNPAVYFHAALFLHMALKANNDSVKGLRVTELDTIERELFELAKQRLDARLPNWQELLPSR